MAGNQYQGREILPVTTRGDELQQDTDANIESLLRVLKNEPLFDFLLRLELEREVKGKEVEENAQKRFDKLKTRTTRPEDNPNFQDDTRTQEKRKKDAEKRIARGFLRLPTGSFKDFEVRVIRILFDMSFEFIMFDEVNKYNQADQNQRWRKDFYEVMRLKFAGSPERYEAEILALRLKAGQKFPFAEDYLIEHLALAVFDFKLTLPSQWTWKKSVDIAIIFLVFMLIGLNMLIEIKFFDQSQWKQGILIAVFSQVERFLSYLTMLFVYKNYDKSLILKCVLRM